MSEKRQYEPCIRCGRIPLEYEVYCADCGTPVENRCSDEPGPLSNGCTFVNPKTAAYCVKCGEPTIYQLHGLVRASYPPGNRPIGFTFRPD